jgi:rfaE bifunctional protein nucleotidyltransferase chain/domain
MANQSITVKDILNPGLDPAKRFIKDKKELQKIVERLRDNGYRIVLTQGVWDMVHEGHAKYLEKAKSYGDILIVGVDSDELTKQRKGPSRPIVPEGERIRMISHLRHVDILTLRNTGEDIGMLIKLIRPDVLIVSKTTKDFTDQMKKDYRGVCGKVVDLSPQATTSTTARVRQLTMEGAEKLAQKIKKLTDDFIEEIRNGKE